MRSVSHGAALACHVSDASLAMDQASSNLAILPAEARHGAQVAVESLVDEEGPPKALPSSRFVL